MASSDTNAHPMAPAPRWSAWTAGLAAVLERRRVLLTLVCVAAAALAQYWLDQGRHLGGAAGLYVLAALLFAALYGRQTLERPEAAGTRTVRHAVWWPVLGAVVLGTLAWPRFAGNQYTAEGTLLWAGGFALLGVAVWPWRERSKGDTAAVSPSGRAIEALRGLAQRGLVLDGGRLALLAILVIGAFYRLYRIDLIPLEMGCDLPHNYNNIRMLLRHEFPVFFSSYPGREGLFFYLAAPLCWVFGLSHVTIKIAG